MRFFSDGLSAHSAPKGKSKDDRYEILLRWSHVVPDVSEDNGRRRKTRQRVNTTPAPVQMPVASFKTGCTPTDRSKADNNEMFKKRCESCLGLYYGQVVPDPDIMSTAKDNRIRRKCFYCDSRID